MRCVLLALLLVALVPGIARGAPLANTAHLDYLGETVSPPPQAGHSTYGSAPLGVLWTYADLRAGGIYERIGGGPYDPATNTYGQGAFNADDIARAAVVYVRHWHQTGAAASRERAVGLLRGLTYLQSPNGNVVLWMQPDGTLNPSAEPVELPDPSDSGPSYWLARTVWALGEGQRAFKREDPAFARFLAERMDLAIDALERQVLDKYGRWQIVDGKRVPAWLIADGADATSEAMFGLAAYGTPRARRALERFGEGVAALSTAGGGQEKGTQAAQILATPGRDTDWARTWPYGAVLPWALSRSIWHAWGAQMPTALVASGHLSPALADAASFTPHLLIAGGPENGWNPTPTDGVQIAYGADARLQTLLATGEHRPGLRRLASFAAAWYFGNNPAKAPMYDPATGRTFDGVTRDGTINRNSGAESTIHGLLSMIALDGAADVAAPARDAIPVQRTTWRMVEAESATLGGGASVVTPPETWTGESAYSGAYVSGGTVTFDGVAGLVQPVAFRTADGSGGSSRWGALGTLSHRDAGPQGASAIPGLIEIQTLERPASGRVTATLGANTRLDAILVQPLIESLTLPGQTLARSFDGRPRRVPLPGRVTSYDTSGREYDRGRGSVVIPSGGFAIAVG